MFNPTQMLDPAVVAFFKQAGPAFGDCVKAEAEGKLDKVLDRFCDGERPDGVDHPQFQNKCMVYAAKAFAAAHIDGTVSWGGVKTIFDETPVWPPPPSMNGRGSLFLAYMIGFLHGSDLPKERQAKIEALLPMAAQVAASPETFAKGLGVNPDQLKAMAAKMGARGLDGMTDFFKKDSP